MAKKKKRVEMWLADVIRQSGKPHRVVAKKLEFFEEKDFFMLVPGQEICWESNSLLGFNTKFLKKTRTPRLFETLNGALTNLFMAYEKMAARERLVLEDRESIISLIELELEKEAS